ncbi:MAG: AgmX/PglI C-terminal domain-containing protein [Deltaproteobacteria bacterium]|nr:AgmX/PglI C-terminal domain-containing protein [Deltaproteobacteria bacterium]
MKPNKNHGSTWVTLSLLALIAATAAYYFVDEKPAKPSADQAATPNSKPLQADTLAGPERNQPETPLESPARKTALRKKAYPRPKNTIDLESRQKMLADLLAKLARAGSGSPAKTSPAEGKPVPGSLSKKYIQESIKEIIPLIKECYHMALAENPNLAGKITVRFTIIADQEYGGLVEESQVLDDSELAANPMLNECFRETMYALKIKAPEGGGRVTVNYPFVLRNSKPDEGKSE